jgi:hypothetical protein
MGLSSFNLFRPHKKRLAGKQFAAGAYVKQIVTELWNFMLSLWELLTVVRNWHALTQVVHLTPALATRADCNSEMALLRDSVPNRLAVHR